MKMTHIFYSSIAPTGVYTDGEGNYMEVKWKPTNDTAAPMSPPPSRGERKFSGIVESLNRIAKAVEGIEKTLGDS